MRHAGKHTKSDRLKQIPSKDNHLLPVKPAVTNIIPRDPITDVEDFESFSCDVIDDGPLTPDKVNPDIRVRRRFQNFNLTMPDGATFEVWVFIDPAGPVQFPSKTIRVKENQIVHVELTQLGKHVHTIHHHGIEPTTFNDGVGKDSFEVDAHYTYQWFASHAGTYFYHCHVNTVLHFEMGLYGFLIIDPPQGEGFVRRINEVITYDVEGLWVADDIDPDWHAFVHDAGLQCLFAQEDATLNVFVPEHFLISGVAHPETRTDAGVVVNAEVGQRILIRLLNASYSIVRATIEGLDAEVIEIDGRTLGHVQESLYSRPFSVEAGTPFELSTAQRWAFLIEPEITGNFKVIMEYLHWVTGEVQGIAETFINVTDITPPTGTVTINNGKLFTNDPTVNLSFTSSETKFARMRFSDNATALASASYQSFSQTGSFTFPGTNGVKTIYAQFKDAAGNESSVVSASVELDTGLPTGIVTINEGARFTNNRNVNLALNAEDAATFVTHMRFAQSEAALAGTSYKPFALSDTLTLNGGEGTKTVFAQFKDAAGNESLVVSDSIIYDTAPTGLVTINNGAAYTRSTSVTLGLTCNDLGSGCSAVRRAHSLIELAVAPWEPFLPSMAWNLMPGDGKKEVFVQYQDRQGNTSALFSDFIYLDTKAPTIKPGTSVKITKVAANRWRIVGFPDDPGCVGRSSACSPQLRMAVRVFNSRGAQVAFPISSWVLDGRAAPVDITVRAKGKYVLHIYFQDLARNLRRVKIATIVA